MTDRDMRDEYDFSDGIRGKFYRPGTKKRYVITYDHRPELGRFDLRSTTGGYQYTLSDEAGTVLLRSESFASKEAALESIDHLRETIVGAETFTSA